MESHPALVGQSYMGWNYMPYIRGAEVSPATDTEPASYMQVKLATAESGKQNCFNIVNGSGEKGSVTAEGFNFAIIDARAKEGDRRPRVCLYTAPDCNTQDLTLEMKLGATWEAPDAPKHQSFKFIKKSETCFTARDREYYKRHNILLDGDNSYVEPQWIFYSFAAQNLATRDEVDRAIEAIPNLDNILAFPDFGYALLSPRNWLAYTRAAEYGVEYESVNLEDYPETQ